MGNDIWIYSENEDHWIDPGVEYDTPEEAAAEYFSDEPEMSGVYVGRKIKPQLLRLTWGLFDWSSIVDTLGDAAYEEYGNEDFPDPAKVNEEQENHLREVLTSALERELEKLGIWPPEFFSVEDIKRVDNPEGGGARL